MTEQDRRVRRTRRLLQESFITLILERGYERTTVQDILDRADVGRSTFYAHFRDKEALLEACFDGLREELAPVGGFTQPATAIFAHAYRHRRVYKALCGRRGGAVVHRHLHRLIGERLHSAPPTAAPAVPAEVVAEFHTSAILGLLSWWVDQNFRYGPARLAEMYHELTGASAM